ncbi:Alpha-1A adrenergic receptor [Trichoplax sp. H2]|nr:Alpha-1A adrenergic receptor [Trichoplax sp. H2]|eukprot:RDD42346.1 Alpha-1A adrenergic receptor [Trichoplax sp. H2]
MACTNITAILNRTLTPTGINKLAENANIPQEQDSSLNLGEKFKLVTIILIMAVAVIANGIVITAILLSKKLRSKHKFLLSECCANFLFALLIMPLSPIQGLLGWWPFGHIYCNINFSVSIALVFTSILNILALTIERYISICHPFKRHFILKSSHVVVILLYVWIQPLVLSLIIFIWRDISYQYRPKQCMPESPQKYQTYEKPYFTFLITSNFFIPVLLIAVMYVCIIRIAWRQNQHIRSQHKQLNHSLNKKMNITIKTTDLRATFVSVIILGIFCVCWMPFFIITLTVAYDIRYNPGQFLFISIILAYVNFAINPIIYTMLTSDIKSAVKSLFPCQESYAFRNRSRSLSKTTNV